MGPIFHLLYISHAAEDLSYTDIREILAQSRENNSQADISGFLVYRDGYFLQLLEGSENSVKNCLGKIMVDDRNHSLRVLVEVSSESRLFGGWDMAFVDGDLSSNETEELLQLFDVCLVSGSQRALIMPMVRKFRASAPILT